MSTGAKTLEGKARQLAGFYRWLAEQKAKKERRVSQAGSASNAGCTTA
jgi:hypothetical protein